MYNVNNAVKFMIISIVMVLIMTSTNFAQYVPGQTYFGTNNYVEYKCGNYPLIITVPHGGYLEPAEMADRTCGVTVNDQYLQEIGRYIIDSIYAKTGKYPHVIFSLIKRLKLDPNRSLAEATCGDSAATVTYNEYHRFIDSAKAMLISQYGKGLLIDLHGHGHSIQRIELGYLLTSEDLSVPDNVLDSSLYVNKSGFKHLAGIVPFSFSKLIRGPKSLGQFFDESGYPTVPSPVVPSPGTDPYYDGGYTVAVHGSRNGGTIDAVLAEMNFSGIRNTDANRKIFSRTFARVVDRFVQVHYFNSPDTIIVIDTLKTASSGNWSNPSVWQGGVVPNFQNDVVIGDGHIISVDNTLAECKNISFGSTTSKLAMLSNSALNVYGNFTLNATTHNAFSAWASGAKVKFRGNAIQYLSGWATSGFSTSFNEMVVDKTGGKVVTFGNNMKLGIGLSLDIVSGLFQLAGTDDIESRTWDGSAATASITVMSEGAFDMLGSSSVIRRGNFIGDETGKIGKLTVHGTASIVTGTTSGKVNFAGIDVEDGGNLDMPLSRGTVANAFNSGVITIKSGGKFKNSLNTAFWYNNPTVLPTIVIESGGEYEASSTNTTLPQGGIIQNSGSAIRFSSGSATNIPAGLTNIKTLILSGSGSKALNANTTIEEVIQLSSTFTTLDLNGFTLSYDPTAVLRYGASGQSTSQTTTGSEWPIVGGPNNVQIYNTSGVTLHENRTISGSLILTLGQFDNNGSDDNKVLTLGDGSTILRARGTLSSSPAFTSNVNVTYNSPSTKVTTGFELPTADNVLNNLNIETAQGIILGGPAYVKGILNLTNSSITLGSHNLTLGGGASVGGTPSSSNMIVADGSGELRKVFNGIGSFLFPIGDNTSTPEYSPASVTFTSGTFSANAFVGVNVKNVIHPNFLAPPVDYLTRYWTLSQNGITSFLSDVKFKYTDADIVGNNESNILLSRYDGVWSNPTNYSTNVNLNELSGTVSNLSDFTGSDNGAIPVELSAFSAEAKRNEVILKWETATETNNYGFEIERRRDNSEFVKVGFVAGIGTSTNSNNYSFVDNNLNKAVYSYRLKQIDLDGSYSYSNEINVENTLPNDYSLDQNYPNPFNPSTKIDYALKDDANVSLELFNGLGEKVLTIVNEAQSAGYYTVEINSNKVKLASGIYFARFIATQVNTNQKFTKTIKLVMNK